MLNKTEKKIVYLDNEALRYMYYSYTGERSYPVMKKLYTLLHEGYLNNWLVTPLSNDHILPYLRESSIEPRFFAMMGGIGQVQYFQRFTVKTLQLIRVLNNVFGNKYDKPPWRDVFTSDPDEKTKTGFNRYTSINNVNVSQANSRENNYSHIHEFIEGYKIGTPVEKLAQLHFKTIWEQFPDLMKPHLPRVGAAETHRNTFLANEDIKDIPEFHILSSLLYSLFETSGMASVEQGELDEELLAAEIMSSYLPYCNYFVTRDNIAELAVKLGIDVFYNTRVYGLNENSLFLLIDEITEDHKTALKEQNTNSQHTIFQKGGTKW
jgi:hypothetical protein